MRCEAQGYSTVPRSTTNTRHRHHESGTQETTATQHAKGMQTHPRSTRDNTSTHVRTLSMCHTRFGKVYTHTHALHTVYFLFPAPPPLSPPRLPPFPPSSPPFFYLQLFLREYLHNKFHSLIPLILFVISIPFWVAGIVMYTTSVTNWLVSTQHTHMTVT